MLSEGRLTPSIRRESQPADGRPDDGRPDDGQASETGRRYSGSMTPWMWAAALLVPWMVSAGCGGCDARVTHLDQGIEAPDKPAPAELEAVAGFGADEAATACTAWVDCEDGDPCTENRCIESSCVSVSVGLGACCQADPLYFADFDAEMSSAEMPFELTSPVGTVGWATSKERSVSPPLSLYFGDLDKLTYASGEPVSGQALFPPMDLPGGHEIRVSFRVFADIEPHPLFDLLRLYADVLDEDGAVVHTRLVLDKAALPIAAYQGFALVELDLDGLEGRRVQLRLAFDSIDADNNAYEGVYIDDFEVAATCPLEVAACDSDVDCEDADPCTLGACSPEGCVYEYDLSCDADFFEPSDVVGLPGLAHPTVPGDALGDSTTDGSGDDGSGADDDGTGVDGTGADGTGTDGTGTDGTGTDGTGTDGTGADCTGADGTRGDTTGGDGTGGGIDGPGGDGSSGGESDQTWDPSDPCGAPGAPANCCQTDADCDDGNPATLNVCEGADCVATINPDACSSAVECDDGEPCTIDSCSGSLCHHEGGYGAACCIPGDVPLADFDGDSLQGIYVTDNLESGVFWTTDKTRSTSGSFGLYCGDPVPQTYAIGQRVKSSATTPVLEIPVGGHTALSFDLWKGTRPSANVDLLQVFVLREGALLPAWSSQALVAGTTAGAWQQVTVGLGEYAGQAIQLRFVFDSVNGGPAAPFEGTYIDTLGLQTTCQ